MNRIYVLALLILPAMSLRAQSIGPDVTSWILNTSGQTGYKGIPSNVQKVQYSDNNVYVSCTCIPSYDIGPWQGNPNQAINQNFVFRITRSPQQNSGTPTPTPNGHIGVWSNGVSIFNAKDARSYNNQNIWNQNAILVERISFDDCLGHPTGNGEYHHHLNPRCLYDDRDSSVHSPIIGYAFDGYPIYGAYGYSGVDGSGGSTRMRSSYRLRAITDRTTLPDATVLQPSQYGPAISAQYPLGYYIEDFEYAAGLGDLDEHNGRFSVTPEYPEGTYAYFVTLDADGEAAYPYTLGPSYRGIVSAGNTGPGSGHNVPTEAVVTYTPAGVDREEEVVASIYPNPASERVMIAAPPTGERWSITLFDLLGRELQRVDVPAGEQTTLPLAGIAAGSYLITFSSTDSTHRAKLIITR